MARLTGPLHSLAASGRVGDKLVFRDAVVGPQVVHRVPASGVASTAQAAQRNKFAAANLLWTATDWTALDLTSWAWEAARINPQSSTYNAMLRAYILEKTALAWSPIRLDHVTPRADHRLGVFIRKDTVPQFNIRVDTSLSPSGPWSTRTGDGFDGGTTWQCISNVLVAGHLYYTRVRWPAASNNVGRTAITFATTI